LRQVAVLALPDEDRGTRIVAILAAAAAAPSLVELKVFCGEHLPAYMIPDTFRFLDELPATSTGKTDYQAILNMLR
jgi:acyl-CoA synthetase (AMP-forming)/AMP-acid ligase II